MLCFCGCVGHGRPGILGRKGRKCIAKWNSGLKFANGCCETAPANVRFYVKPGCIGRPWRRSFNIPHPLGISVPGPRKNPRSVPTGSGLVRIWRQTSSPSLATLCSQQPLPVAMQPKDGKNAIFVLHVGVGQQFVKERDGSGRRGIGRALVSDRCTQFREGLHPHSRVLR